MTGMKVLLTMVCVTSLNGALLYPLLMLGADRQVCVAIEAAMLSFGGVSLYLLYRFRKRL